MSSIELTEFEMFIFGEISITSCFVFPWLLKETLPGHFFSWSTGSFRKVKNMQV